MSSRCRIEDFSGAAETNAGDRGGSSVDVEQEQDAIPTAKQLKVAAAEEKRLLRDEAAAEKKVIKARARLAKAEGALNDARARFERRAKDVAEAESDLRNRQTARANGPVRAEPTETEPIANEPAGSTSDSGS